MTVDDDLFAEWDARRAGLGNANPAADPVTFTDPPAAPVARVRYVSSAIDDECRQVAQAPRGTRNAQLNTSALKLGRLVAGGHTTQDEIRAALLRAADIAGLGPVEAAKTISSGIRKGLQHPRHPGPPPVTMSAEPVGDVVDITERIATAVAHAVSPAAGTDDLGQYLVSGGAYLLQLPDQLPAVWGSGDDVLWAEGEALMIAGGQGLGKTTLAGQLVRGRLGLQPEVLGFPVKPGERVLWLMMDRPQQQARSARRHFTRDELELIDRDGTLLLMIGPPPHDLARHPELLTQLCRAAAADTVVVDSLKDAAIGLTEDEVGAGWNRARQYAVAAGVQVLELHHLVKRGADGRPPSTLSDVYGSTWLTSGCGSVVLLTGDAGDPIVKAAHLKQPADVVGPLVLAHDHARGVTTVHEGRSDLLAHLAVTKTVTATSAAAHWFETEHPTAAQRERARRKLDDLVTKGLAWSQPGRPGGTAGENATRYHPHTWRPAGEELPELPELSPPDSTAASAAGEIAAVTVPAEQSEPEQLDLSDVVLHGELIEPDTVEDDT